MKQKLDDRFARGEETVPGIYFDQDPRSPRGFLLQVTPADARAWRLNYRVKGSGVERRITIGGVSSWPIVAARKRAHELRRLVDTGGDPLRDLEEARAAPTIADLVARFEAEAMPGRAPKTQREYKAMLTSWILPAIGRRKVADVAREDIEKLHRHVTAGTGDGRGGPRRGNTVKSLCSVLFNQAIVWGWRDPHTNPCENIAGNAEHGRSRYLTGQEITRLMGVLEQRRREDESRWRDSTDVVMLALLTGARRGELLSMEWGHLDLDTGTWIVPAALTKQRQERRGVLSADAVALLRQRQQSATRSLRQVFRRGNSVAGQHALDVDWASIRSAAGLEDVHFHDLRHSFASLLVGEGLSLPTIGRMLGHSKPATTARYAHLADKPLRDAAEKVAKLVRGK
jgi:integrase